MRNDWPVYRDWIRSRLPKDIPDHVIRAGENFGGYVSGLQVWAFGDRGPDEIIYTASDEEDLKLWLFEDEVRSIAIKIELATRAEEEKNWRYVRDHAENGAWIYRENKQYKYDAIHDWRKYWMEYMLRLMYPVFPNDRWVQRVEHYENLMNHGFKIKHWEYDMDTKCFVEISHSKEVNTDGIEELGDPSRIIPSAE